MNEEANNAPGAPGHAMSRIVALMNQKGGVGKTTTAVNLAAGVALAGRRTLLVDLDPQAHATIHLGVDPDEAPASVYDLLLDDERDPHEGVVETRPNLGLLASTVDLAGAEVELSGRSDRQHRLQRVIESLRPEYEFVFIDCPPSLGLLTLNGLAAAREIIVPMQAHFLALQGLGKLLETASLVGRGVNPKVRVSGVVLCMHDENTRHAREVVEDLERFFEQSRDQDVAWSGAGVYRPAIRRNIKLAESPSFGQTIYEYEPRCAGAEDYSRLTRAFVTQWDRFLERRQTQGDATRIEVRPIGTGTAGGRGV